MKYASDASIILSKPTHFRRGIEWRSEIFMKSLTFLACIAKNWLFFRYANFAMASQILKIDMPSKRLFSFLWWGVKFCWVNLSKRHIWKSNYMSRHEMSNIDFSSMQITFVPSFLEAFLHWITFITHIRIVQNAILQFHTFQPQNCNKINSLILQFYFRQNWCIHYFSLYYWINLLLFSMHSICR